MKHPYLSVFEGTIKPEKVQLYYKVALVLVAMMMVILPLVYLAVIIGIGFGVYYHATHSVALFKWSGGGWLRIILYLAPIFSGAILLFFMIKPLFMRWRKVNTIQLAPEKEPLLFAFVAEVCNRVGAPAPQSIEINCDINAMASFRRGFMSFLSNDLTLTIGMPLVAGVNMKQFAGILAHEFGHFTQGFAMRFNYIIQTINAWFRQFVHEKDAIDDLLDRWSANKDFRVAIIFWLAKICVWITNQILRIFMFMGSMISSYLLRQMEYDADRYEILLAGSDTFAATLTQISAINIAYQNAFNDLYQSFTENKLVNDIPNLTRTCLEKLPKDIDAQIKESINNQKTGKFDTHPSDLNRIQNAHRKNARGIFHLVEPATRLFTNFDSVSQEVTGLFYLGRFGPGYKSKKMLSIADLESEQDVAREEEKALARFFMNTVNIYQPVKLELSEKKDIPKDNLIHTITESRQRMQPALAKARQALEQVENAETRRLQVMQIDALLEIGIRINTQEFDLSDGSKETLEKEIERAKSARDLALAQLEEITGYSIMRLQSVFHLLKFSEPALSLANSRDLTEEFLQLNGVLDALCSQRATFLRLREQYFILMTCLKNLKGREKDEAINLRIANILEASHAAILSAQNKLANISYPFDYAGTTINMNKYLIEKLPDWQNLELMYHAILSWLEKFSLVYYRVLGRLAFIAEAVETDAGLAPLEEPEKKVAEIRTQ